MGAHAAQDRSGVLAEDGELPPLANVYEIPTLVRHDTGTKDVRSATLYDLLKSDESFILVAGPGGGKSAALRMCCVGAEVAMGMHGIPHIVPVPVLASDIDPSEPITSSLWRSLNRIPSFSESRWSEDLFDNAPIPGHRWCLLVDGLDEVVDRNRRVRIVAKLHEVLRSHKQLRIVIATRPLALAEHSGLGRLVGPVWLLEPLTRLQQVAVVRSWIGDAGDPGDVDRRVVGILAQTPEDLLGNPLLLSIACRIRAIDASAEIPGSRYGLLQAYCDAVRRVFYRPEGRPLIDEAIEAAAPFGPRSKLAAQEVIEGTYHYLGGSALSWIESGRDRPIVEMPSPPAGSGIGKVEWEDLCRNIYRRSGLVHLEEDEVLFVHQIVAEFAAADECARDEARGARLLTVLVGEAPPMDIWANHSFMRFVSSKWIEEDRFLEYLRVSIARGDQHALDLIAGLAADRIAVPRSLVPIVSAAMAMSFDDHTDLFALERAIDVRTAIADLHLVPDLLALSESSEARPDVRMRAYLAAVGRHMGSASPSDGELVGWSDGLRFDLRKWFSGTEEWILNGAVSLARDDRIGYFDRLELVEALSFVGNEAASELSGVLGQSRIVPLLRAVRSGHPNSDVALIERAFQVAERAHRGQENRSSDSHVTHPVAVATILADLGFEGTTIAGAMLRNTVGGADYSLDLLRNDFGDEIALLVDGVVQLDKVQYGDSAQADEVRKMVVAMAKDIRVLVIKLADRLHNARTWLGERSKSAERSAIETLEIYAPLAHRLGMGVVKRELEELSFQALYPKVYEEIVHLVAERAPVREEALREVNDWINSDLSASGIEAVVTGRPNHYYSIYRRMIIRGHDFAETYDLTATHLLVGSVSDCYAALGVMHARWNPIPGTFEDKIAMPEFGIYQSLETTVIGPGGKPVEIQIRTHDMHRRAEYGIGAGLRKHKEEADRRAGGIALGGDSEGEPGRPEMEWLRQLVDWQRETADPLEFLEFLRFEISGGEVYVFTPKGAAMALPAGATPVDFAYGLDGDVGRRTMGARVNGRLVPLDSPLESGDVVDILTSKSEAAGPSADWLGFVKSPRARNKIRLWFTKGRREEAIGKDAIAKSMRSQGLPSHRIISDETLAEVANEMGFSDASGLYAAVGEGRIAVVDAALNLIEASTARLRLAPSRGSISSGVAARRVRSIDPGVVVKGSGSSTVWVKLAKCCAPLPGDEIVGFVTRGQGISVHHTDCVNLVGLGRQSDRMVEVEWTDTAGGVVWVQIHVEALDRTGLLSDIAQVLADNKVNIVSALGSVSQDRLVNLRFSLQLADLAQLGQAFAAVRAVDGVFDLTRSSSVEAEDRRHYPI